MTKIFSHQWTLFSELDRNSWHRQILSWRQKNAGAGWLGQVPKPWLASLHWLGQLPSLASPVALLLYKKKTSGTDIRRTPDVKLRFASFNRFVGLNFGKIQLLRFVVLMVWSNSFGHLDSVKWITLIWFPVFRLLLYYHNLVVFWMCW